MADPYNGGRFERTPTGQLRWVPFSTEDARQAALARDREVGANFLLSNLRNPVPVPLVTPALDALGNITGATAAAFVNAGPNLGRMFFGGSGRQDAPAPAQEAPRASALSFGGPQPMSMNPTSFRATGGASPAPSLAGLEAQFSGPPQGNGMDAAWNVFINGLIPQESGGRAGVEGPQTKWGRAQGLTQMLPSTAKGVAEKHGIPWQPERMRGTSPEDAAYQRNLGWLYFQEGLEKTGSLQGALMYYHGGPNRRQWGPKTQTYAQEVMQRALNGGSLPGGSRVNSATSGPGFVPMDGRALAAMIPDPQLMRSVVLPDAPQMEEPDARPQQQMLDKNQFLGPLAQALEVPERDRSRDAWERVQSMLGSAASAMAGQTDTVDMLLAGGGAAQKGFQGERDRQRELDRADEDARRQARAMLAKAGMDVDLANLATTNANLDRAWQDKVDKAQVKFANLSATNQRAVQEILTNVEVSRYNTGLVNQTALARAQAGMGAYEANNTLANRSIAAGWQADQQRQNLVQQTQAKLALSGGIGNTAGLLNAVGVPLEPVRGETPDVTNARATAGFVAAGNVPMVVNSLGQELLLTGAYTQLLTEDDVKTVQKMLQQDNTAGAAVLIGQVLNNALRGPEADLVVNAIDELATMGGHPSAQIISNARQRQAAQQ